MIPLAAKNLTCGYGERKVLESLSLEARAGEVLVLLGPNGAGKTTLLRALARFIRPLGGEVLLHDRDIWQFSADAASRELALMPQTERRDWPLSVEESVLLGRAPHRGWLLPYSAEDRAIVAAAIASTGLESLRERPITELSGGEWRRMIFARALAQQASVLLLDEPTAGLDLKYQHEVLSLASKLAKERGLTVVLTLHDLNHAALYGNRLALIAERKLIAIGPAREVITAELMQSVFDVRVTVVPHPIYGTPLAIPLVASAPAASAEANTGPQP